MAFAFDGGQHDQAGVLIRCDVGFGLGVGRFADKAAVDRDLLTVAIADREIPPA